MTASPDDDITMILDEYVSAIRQGRRISKEELLRRCPQFAEELSGCLKTLDALQGCATVDLSGVEPSCHEPETRTLGDFRLHREIGRGGMGIVYEAEQISLGRRVALKILPFASVLDPRQLQRFKNEAMAAAHLDHPNIVEVYGIGCERSVHYYAMRLIEGITLAEWLAAQSSDIEEAAPYRARSADDGNPEQCAARASEADESDRSRIGSEQDDALSETKRIAQAVIHTVATPNPVEQFRQIARIGAEAAAALDHAHQMGIVHRDIKPSNLLLDTRGKVWITDFGLARNANDASLTMSGDLVGTLRYMSPERALAKRVTVDHRTDVYSLGVTLYELLVKRPAFGGMDREEILREIAFAEPTPIQRCNRRVPGELATIVTKAMEKNPQDRYATAADLAEDLRRFLEHRPILARRPRLAHRLMKWTRRHSLFVTTSAVFASIVAVTLGFSFWLATQAYQSERAQKTAAESATVEAKKNLLTALEAINTMLIQIADRELVDIPQTLALRKRTYLTAIALCDSISASEPLSDELSIALFNAHLGVSRAARSLTEATIQQTHLARAKEIIRAYLAKYPEKPESLEYQLEYLLDEYDLTPTEDLRQEIRRCEQLRNGSPLTPLFAEQKARIINDFVYVPGRRMSQQVLDDAEALSEVVIAASPKWPNDIHVRNALASLRVRRIADLRELGRFDEAIKDYDNLVRIMDGKGISSVQRQMVPVLYVTGRLDEARELCSSLMTEQLVWNREAPAHDQSFWEYLEMGRILRMERKSEEAVRMLLTGKEQLLRAIYKIVPNTSGTTNRQAQQLTCFQLEIIDELIQTGNDSEAQEEYCDHIRELKELIEDLKGKNLGEAHHVLELSVIHHSYSMFLLKRKRMNEAKREYKAAIDVAGSQGRDVERLLAYFLAASPFEELRNPAKALQLTEPYLSEMPVMATNLPRAIAQLRLGGMKAANPDEVDLFVQETSCFYIWWAAINFRLGFNDLAAEYMNLSIATSPRSRSTPLSIRYHGRIEEALMEIEKHTHLPPDHPLRHCWMLVPPSSTGKLDRPAELTEE